MACSDSNPVTAETNEVCINRFLEEVPAESISDSASRGDFSHILKLQKVLHQNQSEAEKLDFLTNLRRFTCGKTWRTLIHWAALHHQLQILKWILSESGDVKFNLLGVSFVNERDIYGYTALHLAVQANHMDSHVDIVRALLKHSDADVSIAAENMRACQQNKTKSNGLTPLHFAARNGSLPIVKLLLESKENILQAISVKSASLKTVLHYAAQGGNWRVVRCLLRLLNMNGMSGVVNQCDILRQTPLYLAVLHENVEILEILLREGRRLNKNTVTWEGMTALDAAKRNEYQRKENMRKELNGLDIPKRNAYLQSIETKKKHQRIVDMLESYDVNWLQSERQKYANAANCLLVGAALIAGVTYAGWLQPPLGFTQYYEFPTSNPAAPPETFESYVGVKQHSEIQMFWFFNSMSFFCSVATFIIGADAGIPDKCASLREEVVQLRNSVVRASFVLSVAILFVIGAFAAAGILVLPPIQRQRAPIYVTVAIGVTLCLFLLWKFIRKLKRWFLSPSLQYKREYAQPSDGCSNADFIDGDTQQTVGMKCPDDWSNANINLLDDCPKDVSQHSGHKRLEEQRSDLNYLASPPNFSVERVSRFFQGQCGRSFEHSVERLHRPFEEAMRVASTYKEEEEL